MEEKRIINDFGITFSTINGSGSTTANNIILKAIFKMDIPVSARNVFPSNIQGMPTWYSLRVSKAGYLGRLEKDDMLVAMNPASLMSDLDNLKPGGVLLINESMEIPEEKKNMRVYRMPVDEILQLAEAPSNLTLYLANMVYVGILAYLIHIDLNHIENALIQHFQGRMSAVETNMGLIRASYDWAGKNIRNPCPYYLMPGNWEESKILVDGNTASALGALYGGLQFNAWYPITPASSLSESINEYIPKIRTDAETGLSNCVVVQAEDELSAIGMVVGAGWAGLRAMTATSGPGLCLMAEFLGLAYFAEIPAVVWDVQRVGPSTGLPTHTSQGDLTFAYFLGHGDKDLIILLPATVNECFEFGWKALDIAEVIQSPVIVLSDLDLGMNPWMADPFQYPDKAIQRGKILWEDDLKSAQGVFSKDYGRYSDVDQDGIPSRTVPGNMHPDAAYFTRGTGHDEYGHYSEDAETWEKNLNRLKKKIEGAIDLLPPPILESQNSSQIGVIAYGSTHFPVAEAIDQFSNRGVIMDYLRIRSLPCGKEVCDFIEKHEQVFVIENNRDGQLMQILCVTFPEMAYKFSKLSKCDGMSLSAEWIVNNLQALLQKEVAG